MTALDATGYQQFDKLSRWPLRAIQNGRNTESGYGVSLYLVEILPPPILPGKHTQPVLDVTSFAPELELNNGAIHADGSLWHGPGEVYAVIPDEGSYATIRLKDGSMRQVQVAYITVTVSLSTPTGDELYPEARQATDERIEP